MAWITYKPAEWKAKKMNAHKTKQNEKRSEKIRKNVFGASAIAISHTKTKSMTRGKSDNLQLWFVRASQFPNPMQLLQNSLLADVKTKEMSSNCIANLAS